MNRLNLICIFPILHFTPGVKKIGAWGKGFKNFEGKLE